MSESDPEVMACGICAAVLFAARSGGEVVMWLHREELVGVWDEMSDVPVEVIEEIRQRLGLSPVDHVAVPVPATEVQTATLCDFCSQPNPQWVLPVESFEANSQQGFEKDWAVCAVCARLLKKGRWDGVLDRALDNASAKYQVSRTEPRLVEGLKAFISQVREYQSGPVRRR